MELEGGVRGFSRDNKRNRQLMKCSVELNIAFPPAHSSLLDAKKGREGEIDMKKGRGNLERRMGGVGKENGRSWKGEWKELERRMGRVGKENGRNWQGEWEEFGERVGELEGRIGRGMGGIWKGQWEKFEDRVGERDENGIHWQGERVN